MLKKLKENRGLKIIFNILYALLVILVLLILFIVVLQKVSNNNWSLGGFRIFNVVTASMEPKYMVGDVLLSKTVDVNDIKVGDDVVYRGEEQNYAGKIITHEVIDIQKTDGKLVFHTKGIANDIEDPVISGDQILGVALGKIPGLSQLSHIINNLYAFYFIIFIPLVLVIFIEIRRGVINFRDRNDEEEDEGEGEKDKEEPPVGYANSTLDKEAKNIENKKEEKKKHGRRMK